MADNFKKTILEGIPESIPDMPAMDPDIARAPKRIIEDLLSEEEHKLALSNALRYFRR